MSAAEQSVPLGVQIAGAWAWRLLVIAGAFAVIVFLVMQLRLIVIPLFVAILLAALLVPFVQFLQRSRWPKWLAVALAEIGLIAIVTGLVWLIVTQVSSGLPDLQAKSLVALEDFKVLLANSPLHLSETQINDYFAQLWQSIQADSSGLVTGALSVGTSAGNFVAGMLIALFVTLFMLIDGRGIWLWAVRIFPRRARLAVDGAGLAGWRTLTMFVKVQIFVAAVDAVGIGVGALILGLPLAIPIAIAVFLGSFVPIIGAVATGAIAVFVALVYLGWGPALVMLGIVILVQQIEGHVLQPLVMGTAIKVHPVAVVFAVAGGSILGGIPGALFVVPLVATLNVMVHYVAGGAWRTETQATQKAGRR